MPTLLNMMPGEEKMKFDSEKSEQTNLNSYVEETEKIKSQCFELFFELYEQYPDKSTEELAKQVSDEFNQNYETVQRWAIFDWLDKIMETKYAEIEKKIQQLEQEEKLKEFNDKKDECYTLLMKYMIEERMKEDMALEIISSSLGVDSDLLKENYDNEWKDPIAKEKHMRDKETAKEKIEKKKRNTIKARLQEAIFELIVYSQSKEKILDALEQDTFSRDEIEEMYHDIIKNKAKEIDKEKKKLLVDLNQVYKDLEGKKRALSPEKEMK